MFLREPQALHHTKTRQKSRDMYLSFSIPTGASTTACAASAQAYTVLIAIWLCHANAAEQIQHERREKERKDCAQPELSKNPECQALPRSPSSTLGIYFSNAHSAQDREAGQRGWTARPLKHTS